MKRMIFVLASAVCGLELAAQDHVVIFPVTLWRSPFFQASEYGGAGLCVHEVF